MRPETLALESLRQRIEAAEEEAGSLSDCIDRGQRGGISVADPYRRMDELLQQAKSLKRELAALIASHPKARNEWVDLHIIPLSCIAAESATSTRASVARQTIGKWERVRSGEISYVGTNWYYLADHQQSMRAAVPSVPRKAL